MLPSKGLFSAVPCVFFSDGGCTRAHCHYRHSHQDLVRGGPSIQDVKPLTDSTSDRNSDFARWHPEQVSLVSGIVENAVDEALKSDLTKMPKGALVKKTLDKIFADPDGLKMASQSKSLYQLAPKYKPTPISKLPKHIPVLYVPEKPRLSLRRKKANIEAELNIAEDPTHSVAVETNPNVNNHVEGNLVPKDGNSEQSSHMNEDLGLTKLAEEAHNAIKMQYFSKQMPLSEPFGGDYSMMDMNKDKEIPKVNANTKDGPTGETELAVSNIPPNEDHESNETDFGPVVPTSAPHKPELLEEQHRGSQAVDAAAGTLEGNARSEAANSVVNVEEESGPPAKKKRSESKVALQVSSTADPFIRWTQNKKIRQILGKDVKHKDSSNPFARWMQNKKIREILGKDKKPKTCTTPGPNAQKRCSPLLGDELPEPKISKRIAHKVDEFKPTPIVSEAVKIPSALRHHFCNAFFEEFKKAMDLKDAKTKALDEELQLAMSSKTSSTYKNNCSLLIVKYRKGEKEVEQKKGDLTPSSCPEFTYGWTLYKSFSRYLLSETELRDNGFPLAVPNRPDRAYVDEASRRYTQQVEKPGLKICANCSVEFQLDGKGFPTTKDDCFYHWGKLRKVQHKGQIIEKFTCCGGSLDSAPCEFSVYHVWSGGSEDCMEGFVETRKLPSTMEDHEAGIYALDCEMCYTTKGLELARLTVLDLNGRTVFDEVVRTKNPVLNYCTRFSGIDDRKMSSATHSFDDVRAWILDRFYDKTILVGHSLENDMKALKLIHRTVVDTSVTFPHKFGLPNKMSLKHLANVVLQVDIQENTDGHDSKEDADTCLKLMMKKIREDSKARKPRVIISYNGKRNQQNQ